MPHLCCSIHRAPRVMLSTSNIAPTLGLAATVDFIRCRLFTRGHDFGDYHGRNAGPSSTQSTLDHLIFAVHAG